jgi:hypothetical protein
VEIKRAKVVEVGLVDGVPGCAIHSVAHPSKNNEAHLPLPHQVGTSGPSSQASESLPPRCHYSHHQYRPNHHPLQSHSHTLTGSRLRDPLTQRVNRTKLVLVCHRRPALIVVSRLRNTKISTNTDLLLSIFLSPTDHSAAHLAKALVFALIGEIDEQRASPNLP